ncbi:MAG: hypothetical protein ACEB74_14015 [Desulfovibrio aminophilus]|uniref:hypothetical protein n=1 Tax=Desulfovibrio aminophilus TaxID=81425 RepID=UPI0004039D7C|nr:hypothetical protein [Desulfovibrio aminophilus]MDY0307650.1 hypothetical protein [Desulfovibrionaceae bacterium]
MSRESVEVTLARLEEMLKAHFARDDERSERIKALEEDVDALQALEQRRKGGAAVLALMMGAAATMGGIIAKFVPLFNGK